MSNKKIDIIPVEEMENKKATQTKVQKPITFKAKYYHVFWLFMVGCVIGVLVEGAFTYWDQGHWESHVTFLWGWFNIVYGLGAVLVYYLSVKIEKYNMFVKFLAFVVFASVLEWLIGWFAEMVLHTRAWGYESMVIGTYVSVPFSLAWGMLGVMFVKFVLPLINKLFARMQGKAFVIISNICIVLMIINLVISGIVLFRWGQRHDKPVATNGLERFIDEYWPSDKLQERFVEWEMQ